ncbi:hybrid sensor histidine kinase/response regulator [Chlorogloeopsis sp. ULAP01]|uniref:hybrid sensor histidine kinase/response regulator n=1 Tax=Chlorogloeopsis sp. ULAP01 TaxID=3056483 RepID=UPI0025AAE261|nr:hybrid sensor histidine kinase/response regulator [Chlorogloeopsis sp. ULAP01]MDM9380653.1 hybrid sensor histidine kinase/response regulator [Chlorogloeopsis sp. ULAP01]
MSQYKEFEIQMQFLEEATDYLNTLEGILLEIESNNRIAPEKINAALRATHSIKGGAAMMGFHEIADLAHRLEDSFKVLKTQKNSLELDTELQSLLLSGVDWLRQIVELHSQGNAIDGQWLTTFCYPVFADLHQRLGDPIPEDATSMLSPEDDGQNIIPLLFETEVEGCLQRLEAMLAEGEQSTLKEEVVSMAAELGGLGEMLQIEAFMQLCESVTNRLETAHPSQIVEIARAALLMWRRSQALVLANQCSCLPTQIELDDFVCVAEQSSTDETQPIEAANDFLQPEFTAQAWVEEEIITTEFDALVAKFTNHSNSEADFAANISSTDYKLVEHKREINNTNKDRDNSENTVRVPSKQLEQINDLFSELIIQRNGLNLHLERLRKLVRTLNQRVQVLERENQELRTAYDRIATQVIMPSDASSWTLADGGNSSQTQDRESRFNVLEMDRHNELNLLSQEVMETIVQVQEVTADIQLSLEDTDQIARKQNKTSKQLQRKLTQIRMRPLSDIVDRFPRALRELCVEYGKNVHLKIDGANTLIERGILEALNEPLMHLMRNAFDHGIEDAATRRACGKSEQGLIEITALHQGNRTIITVRDDGRGICLEKIRDRALAMGLDATLMAQASDEELLSLIFEPGFTTSDQVTTLSGRGVGMDVVHSNLKQIQGDINIDTAAGVGTTFILSVPFTISVARVLLVESNQMLLAFPTDAILEIFLLENEYVLSMANGEAINWQGSIVPLIRLNRYLQFNCPRYDHPSLETPPAINATSVLIVGDSNQPVAVQIERCWGEVEVAIRQVEGNIPLPAGFSNCTILSDGRVVALMNINELLHTHATNERTRSNQLPPTKLKTVFLNSADEQPTAAPQESKGTILIVDDSINVRRFLSLTLEKGGYQVEQAKDGQDALDKLENGLKINAVICDIEMPRVDGYGFLGRVQSNDELKYIPVAMLTSRSSDKHRQLAMQLGARAYFSKPYNEQELLRTLEEIIFSVSGATNN